MLGLRYRCVGIEVSINSIGDKPHSISDHLRSPRTASRCAPYRGNRAPGSNFNFKEALTRPAHALRTLGGLSEDATASDERDSESACQVELLFEDA